MTDGTLLRRLGVLYMEWAWCPAPAAQLIHQKFWIPDTGGGALRTPWVSQEGWVCCDALLLSFHGAARPGDHLDLGCTTPAPGLSRGKRGSAGSLPSGVRQRRRGSALLWGGGVESLGWERKLWWTRELSLGCTRVVMSRTPLGPGTK